MRPTRRSVLSLAALVAGLGAAYATSLVIKVESALGGKTELYKRISSQLLQLDVSLNRFDNDTLYIETDELEEIAISAKGAAVEFSEAFSDDRNVRAITNFINEIAAKDEKIGETARFCGLDLSKPRRPKYFVEHAETLADSVIEEIGKLKEVEEGDNAAALDRIARLKLEINKLESYVELIVLAAPKGRA